jgi:hypothetical protein
LAMIALVAANRIGLYHDVWLTAALDGRYRLYGLIVAAVCAIDLLRRMESQRWLSRGALVVLIGALALDVDWYFYRANHAYAAAQSRLHAINLWMRTGDTSELPSWANSPEMAGHALARAAEAAVFTPGK